MDVTSRLIQASGDVMSEWRPNKPMQQTALSFSKGRSLYCEAGNQHLTIST